MFNRHHINFFSKGVSFTSQCAGWGGHLYLITCNLFTKAGPWELASRASWPWGDAQEKKHPSYDSDVGGPLRTALGDR